jgi:hypothetical protein
MEGFIDICNSNKRIVNKIKELLNYISSYDNEIKINNEDKYYQLYQLLSYYQKEEYDDMFQYIVNNKNHNDEYLTDYFVCCTCNRSFIDSDDNLKSWLNDNLEKLENYFLSKKYTKSTQGLVYTALGFCYEEIKQKAYEAFKYYSKSYEYDNLLGSVNLALCYKLGYGCDRDINKFLEIMTSKIHTNHPYVLNKLGNYYYKNGENNMKKELGLRYVMGAYLISRKSNNIVEMKTSKVIIGNSFLFDKLLEWYQMIYEKKYNEINNKLISLHFNKNLASIITGYVVE